ncbi:MAG: flagellar basal body-associated FliL family protein [Deltaproteobacteria bacterium]|nr:flagellar basal body-associated FliL family protein [Deltaproteobacteria bacterium]
MSETNEEHEGKAGGSKQSPIILILLAVNLAATGFVVFRQVKLRPVVEHAVKEALKAQDEAQSTDKEKPGPIVATDPMVVNLNEPGKPRYLKASFELEMENEGSLKLFEEQKRHVRDEMLRYLSSLSVADTAGELAKAKLQEELKKRLDKLLGGEKVRRVYFLEFVIQ